MWASLGCPTLANLPFCHLSVQASPLPGACCITQLNPKGPHCVTMAKLDLIGDTCLALLSLDTILVLPISICQPVVCGHRQGHVHSPAQVHAFTRPATCIPQRGIPAYTSKMMSRSLHMVGMSGDMLSSNPHCVAQSPWDLSPKQLLYMCCEAVSAC